MKRPKYTTKHDFHVVKISSCGKFVSYEIWFDNEPYLVSSNAYTVGKVEAYSICRLLNHGFCR
jgi:hypothetical protein